VQCNPEVASDTGAPVGCVVAAQAAESISGGPASWPFHADGADPWADAVTLCIKEDFVEGVSVRGVRQDVHTLGIEGHGELTKFPGF
jgi:hypothetical protein